MGEPHPGDYGVALAPRCARPPFRRRVIFGRTAAGLRVFHCRPLAGLFEHDLLRALVLAQSQKHRVAQDACRRSIRQTDFGDERRPVQCTPFATRPWDAPPPGGAPERIEPRAQVGELCIVEPAPTRPA